MSSEMEKSVTPTTMGKVSKHIPDDILFSILSKLTLKSLKRFECVSKSWSLLFENPYFMRIYRDHIIHRNHSDHDDSDDSSLILRHVVEAPRGLLQISLYLVSGNNFENKVKLDTSLPSQELGQQIIIVGPVSINGILCLTSMVVQDRKVVLWNPATDELKVIPPSPVESLTSVRVFLPKIHGFGYDSVRDDYKVLRYVQFDRFGLLDEHVIWNKKSYEPFWEIYSLRSNSWRKLDIERPNLMVSFADVDSVRFYMDGMCHWWTQEPSRSDDTNEAYVVSFDVSNEVFFTTPMPDDSFDLGLAESHLVMLNGYIALISYYEETATFYISILGEIGVKGSWTKLFTIGSMSIVERPIGAGKKGNILFMTKDEKLVCFDLDTQMIVELGIEGDMYEMVIYKESLLSIRGIEN